MLRGLGAWWTERDEDEGHSMAVSPSCPESDPTYYWNTAVTSLQVMAIIPTLPEQCHYFQLLCQKEYPSLVC